eukprot:scaffold14356_cov194-Skeletonema_marinoi.AAC.8
MSHVARRMYLQDYLPSWLCVILLSIMPSYFYLNCPMSSQQLVAMLSISVFSIKTVDLARLRLLI